MQLPIVASSLLAIASLGLCAPAPEPAKLTKRDVCELHGWVQHEYVIGSGGPGQGPVFEHTHGFRLNYQGGVPIGSSGQDPIHDTTIQGSSLHLPNDISWTVASTPFGFDSCSLTYEGQTVSGTPGGSTPDADKIYYECVVSFQCESNL